MKMFSRILSLMIVSSLGLFYAGCGGKSGDTDPVEKVQLSKLSSTWTISSVTLDGAPRTDFTGFTLTIAGAFSSATPKGPYTYTCAGTRPNPSPWPASGTWKFGANPKTDLLRLDNPDQEMTYTLTDTQLTIDFNYTGDGFAGSRVNQVSGNWEFIFTK